MLGAPIHQLALCLFACASVVASANTSAETSQIGSTRTFWVRNFRTLPASFRQAEANLVAAGPHARIYVEPGTLIPSDYIPTLSAQLEQAAPAGSLFPKLGIIASQEKLFGDLPQTPGGDDRLVVLFTSLGPGAQAVDGFFHPADQWRAGDAEKMGDHSNETNIVYVNGFGQNAETTTSSIARSLQELLSYRTQGGRPRDLWLSQVISGGSLLASGMYPNPEPLHRFAAAASDYPLVSHSSLQYGPQILFACFLLDQAGGQGEALTTLAKLNLNGREAVENLFRSETGSALTFDLIYGNFLSYVFRTAGTGYTLPFTLSPPLGKGVVVPPLEPYVTLKSIPAITQGSLMPYSFAVIDLPDVLPPTAVVQVDTIRIDSGHGFRADGTRPCSETGSVLWKPVSAKRIAVYAVGCEHQSDLDVLHFRLSIWDKPSNR